MFEAIERERYLRLLLRTGGCLLVSAFPTMLLPVDWMAASHEWLGMGPLPRRPVVDYLARSAAALYGFHAVAVDHPRQAAGVGRAAIVFTGAPEPRGPMSGFGYDHFDLHMGDRPRPNFLRYWLGTFRPTLHCGIEAARAISLARCLGKAIGGGDVDQGSPSRGLRPKPETSMSH